MIDLKPGEKIEPLNTNGPDLSELHKALDYFKEAMMRAFSHIPPEPLKVALTINNQSDVDITVARDPKTGGLRIDTQPGNRGPIPEKVEDDFEGEGMTRYALYHSLLRNFDEYISLLQPIRMNGTDSSRLGILNRKIKRQISELYAIPDPEDEEPDPTDDFVRYPEKV